MYSMPEPRTTYKIHRIPYQNHENHQKKILHDRTMKIMKFIEFNAESRKSKQK